MDEQRHVPGIYLAYIQRVPFKQILCIHLVKKRQLVHPDFPLEGSLQFLLAVLECRKISIHIKRSGCKDDLRPLLQDGLERLERDPLEAYNEISVKRNQF